jgi:hypothetical protein
MEKVSMIKRVVFKNEYTGQHGKVFYHEVELDNGDKGQIGCKEKEPAWLNPGHDLTYTIEIGEKGNRIKKVTAPSSGFGGGGKAKPVNNSSFALAYAKDVVIGSWGEHSPKKLSSEDLFKIESHK